MKQITMDFDTYENELKAERLAGAEIVKDLAKILDQAIQDFQSYDRNVYDKALRQLMVFSNNIRKLK